MSPLITLARLSRTTIIVVLVAVCSYLLGRKQSSYHISSLESGIRNWFGAFVTNGYGGKILLDGSAHQIRPSAVFCSEVKMFVNHNDSNQHYCRFEWLCLKNNQFVFVFDPEQSVFFPPELRFSTNYIFGHLSSVLDHNRYQMKNLVTLPYSKVDHQSMTIIPGQTLIMSRFKPDNLMHLIHDDILPLYATIREQNLQEKLDRILFTDEWPHEFGGQFFETLFPNTIHKSQFSKDELICLESAHIGLTRSTIWYQYGFVKPQSPIERSEEEKLYIKTLIHQLRSTLASVLQLNHCTERYSVIISRISNRRILNCERLIQILQASNLNPTKNIVFDVKIFGQHFEQLMQTLHCTQTLISMHGSEQIFSVFISSNQPDIIEIFPYGIEPSQVLPYKTLAHIIGSHYRAIKVSRANSFAHANYPPEWGGLAHLHEQQRSQIEPIDEPLKQHLCCDNPDWLYRIYQDVIVEPGELVQALTQAKPDTPKKRLDLFQIARIENITPIRDGSKVNLTWSQPWNLEFIKVTKIEYQVLIHSHGSEQGLVIQTSIPFAVFDADHCASGCNLWVKVHLTAEHKCDQFELYSQFGDLPLIL